MAWGSERHNNSYSLNGGDTMDPRSVGPNWLRINDILPPRVIRVGGVWDS